ncbi:unnamed protein product [Meloidogyne enterolobii]|uniref:Uncharacterized protein n=1 Tax=Meloidogyne enterolobii TaxID=390850 RepID=A0ACB1A0V1_MELEN
MVFLSTTTQRICNVRVKWNFGSVKIRLPELLVLDWGRAILEAVRGRAEASYESHHCSPTVHYRPTTPILFENSTQTDSVFEEQASIPF